MEMNEVTHSMKVTLGGDGLTYTVQAKDDNRNEVFITARFGGDTVGQWCNVSLISPKGKQS